MANTVKKEEVPNPYNAKKDWHTEDEKSFESSNNVYFEAPQNKLFDSNDITEVGEQGSVNVEELESKKNTAYKLSLIHI